MKTRLTYVALLSFNFCLLSSQVPQGFNYQAIARDNSGNPIVNANNLQVKLAVMADSLGATVYWEELFNPVTTNAYGLLTVTMGQGVRQSTSTVPFFSSINWNNWPLFVRTQVYYQSAWKLMGSSRIWSVPYALNARTAISAIGISGNVPHIGVTSNTAVMDSALFVVRNTTGQIIFAVYNEGVRIYVDNGAKGTNKGGFAVGGFGTGKATSQPLLVVDPDSIRLYINDKLVKGNTKGGFAIGGFGGGKGASNFFDVATDTTGIINPAQNRILWYPLKNAFLTGNIIIENKDSVGVNSFSSGYLSRAKGAYSQALGYKSISRSNYSTAIGRYSLASGSSSYAFGEHAYASGIGAYAFGTFANATGNQSFALGSVGVDTLGNPTGKTIASGFGAFAAGFGSVASAQGAFTLGVADTASGPFATALGYQTAARGWFNTSMGLATKADGVASTAIGWQTQVKASGWGGMAGGCSTVSNNWVAVALGDRTTANGHTSFATGYKSVAMGHLTSAFGDTTTAIGDGAISMGHFTTAQAYGSLVIGRYNLIAGGTSAWNFWDPVFVIGNGTSKTARSNSFTVYNSGIADLQYFINLCSNPVNNTAIQVKGSEALWYDGTYFSWGYGGTYNVFARKTSIGTTANPGTYSLWVAGTAGCTGGLWSGSDIRWKKDLTRLENVIPGILSLSAYKFNWRKDEFPEMNFDRGNQVGLIAQDVEKIFPELVRTDEKGYKAVSYDKLSAILLQGMKEQQAQIDQQKRDNDDLRAELKTLNEEVKQLKAASGNK